jgi:hypothetical protein
MFCSILPSAVSQSAQSSACTLSCDTITVAEARPSFFRLAYILIVIDVHVAKAAEIKP